jgi:hypothetical protein
MNKVEDISPSVSSSSRQNVSETKSILNIIMKEMKENLIMNNIANN